VRVRLKNAYIPCVVGYPLVLPWFSRSASGVSSSPTGRSTGRWWWGWRWGWCCPVLVFWWLVDKNQLSPPRIDPWVPPPISSVLGGFHRFLTLHNHIHPPSCNAALPLSPSLFPPNHPPSRLKSHFSCRVGAPNNMSNLNMHICCWGLPVENQPGQTREEGWDFVSPSPLYCDGPSHCNAKKLTLKTSSSLLIEIWWNIQLCCTQELTTNPTFCLH
jgi:hypothetical protein